MPLLKTTTKLANVLEFDRTTKPIQKLSDFLEPDSTAVQSNSKVVLLNLEAPTPKNVALNARQLKRIDYIYLGEQRLAGAGAAAGPPFINQRWTLLHAKSHLDRNKY